MKRKAV
jgi:serine/threonine protein kinase